MTSKNRDKAFNFWILILFIFLFDVYFERFSGSNILGFGKIEIDGVRQPDGYRVVSFLKMSQLQALIYLAFYFF